MEHVAKISIKYTYCIIFSNQFLLCVNCRRIFEGCNFLEIQRPFCKNQNILQPLRGRFVVCLMMGDRTSVVLIPYNSIFAPFHMRQRPRNFFALNLHRLHRLNKNNRLYLISHSLFCHQIFPWKGISYYQPYQKLSDRKMFLMPSFSLCWYGAHGKYSMYEVLDSFNFCTFKNSAQNLNQHDSQGR